MKKNLFTISLLIVLQFSALSTELADNILIKSDSLLLPDNIKVIQKMTIFKNKRAPFVTESEIYIKGKDKLLIIHKYPKELAGSGILVVGNDQWSYNSALKKITHISNKKPILGSDFNIFDITRNKLHYDYNVISMEDSVIKDKNLHKLTLEAKNSDLPYNKIITYIDKNTKLPFSREYFSKSGLLLKTLIFEDVKMYNSRLCPHKELMISNLEKNSYTTIQYQNLENTVLKESMFTPAFLQFKGN